MSNRIEKKVHPERSRRVFVGMSGGVDSSVAAFLLKEATPDNFEELFGCLPPEGFRGYDVTGVFINGFNVDGCQDKDAEDARRAAEHIGIPFYALDAREEYFEHVVQYMIDGYKKGLTPNPDVMCNKEIKFGIFLDRALKLGADYIATGHYVRLREKHQITNNKSQINSKSKAQNSIELPITNYKLLTARDAQKDQSYFLWTLTQEQLKHCLFPLGGHTKPEVRDIAKKAGLPNAEKKDSQGVCFLGKIKLPDFLKEYIEPKKGDVVDTEGNKIGEHNGVQFYTIGQRHININQISNLKSQKDATNRKPHYVISKDIKTNTLIVAEGDDNPALFKKEIELSDVHFINPELHSTISSSIKTTDGQARLSASDGNRRMDMYVRVRYRQPLVKAKLVISNKESVISKGRKLPITNYRLQFAEPIKFIAPGQSVVFYASEEDKKGGREMLGGGVILG